MLKYPPTLNKHCELTNQSKVVCRELVLQSRSPWHPTKMHPKAVYLPYHCDQLSNNFPNKYTHLGIMDNNLKVYCTFETLSYYGCTNRVRLIQIHNKNILISENHLLAATLWYNFGSCCGVKNKTDFVNKMYFIYLPEQIPPPTSEQNSYFIHYNTMFLQF